MNDQTKIVVADQGEIDALRAELRAIRSILEGATITPAPEWVSIERACEIYRVGKSTIYRKINDGSLEAKGVGKMRRVKIET